MTAMLKVRAAFDPLGLCNPGKIIPMLRGCGEVARFSEPDVISETSSVLATTSYCQPEQTNQNRAA
jgi:hypothetical protein